MTTRQFRSNEVKLQEQLNENIFVLTHMYPPSEEFKTHFKKDMFVKNNKAGFYHVVHYLLNTLNPELTKQKLPSWPPYEIRRESKFRNELIQYINELNSLYEGANIPVLMTSHLISPGGMKILKFMLKLSQLVIFEHLKKTEAVHEILIHNLKNTKSGVTNGYINNLNAARNNTEGETRDAYDDFMNKYNVMSRRAMKMIDEKSLINLELAKMTVRYDRMQEECKGNYIHPPLLEIKNKIDKLKGELEQVKDVKSKFENVESLVSSLISKRNVLDFTNNSSKPPREEQNAPSNPPREEQRAPSNPPREDQSAPSNPSREDLNASIEDERHNFLEFLQNLRNILDESSIHLPHVPPAYFGDLRQQVDEITAKNSESCLRMEKLYEELLQICEQSNQQFANNPHGSPELPDVPKLVLPIDDMSDLAQPLEDTPEAV